VRVLLTATVMSHIAHFHKSLIDMLHGYGCEVHIAARNDLIDKQGLSLDTADKIFDIPFRRSPYSFSNIKAYIELKKYIETYNYEIIHCNTPMGAVITRLAAKSLRKRGTKVLYTARCMRVLGVEKVITGDFPNIQFNTVPHLELVQFIENAIVETQAEVVITHHPADLNNDHFHTSLACQAAVRLFQRRTGIKPLKELLFMEVPSSTEWRLNTGFNQFNPNTYVEVEEIGIEKKIEALSQYQGVMREFPHPRCAEVLWGLAAYRGGQAGMRYAEAFESVFRRGL